MLSVAMVIGLLCYCLTWKDAPYARAEQGPTSSQASEETGQAPTASPAEAVAAHSELTQIKTTKLACGEWEIPIVRIRR